MSATLPSGMLVSALLRRVNDAGGLGMVRARGEAGSGGILVILTENGIDPRLRERAFDLDGMAELRAAGPSEPAPSAAIEDYWRRRRVRDPDLWVIELDIASAERFAAETILGG